MSPLQAIDQQIEQNQKDWIQVSKAWNLAWYYSNEQEMEELDLRIHSLERAQRTLKALRSELEVIA